MSNKDYSGIVIRGETVSIDIMLPKRDIASPTAIKKIIEDRFRVKTEGMYAPIGFTKKGNVVDFDFGEYGQRWHIRVVINLSQRDEFYNFLRILCKEHKLSFNGISHSSIR